MEAASVRSHTGAASRKITGLKQLFAHSLFAIACGSRTCGPPFGLQGSPKSERLTASLDNRRPICDAIQQRLTEPGVGEDLRPF
jgi:hypothetical protein